ncbi:MAG: DUF6033 family protein [Eubacterium sp.]|nr:DUF6033 family protein [Eubacterium sp.]MCM1304636.1 DUF6033 family protein [Butyrivibrio sp.]MCM1345179.1 DUF6033 family protein [Muribaculaceae bacterium]MCM1412139.1 DUF6033 family protein [Lachnospiraceae bacterium]
MSMTVNHSLYDNYAAQNADAALKKKEADDKAKEVKKQDGEVKQPQLSQAAQKLLEKLRKTYGNMDFMVADFQNADEAKTVLSRGTKEFSVLFSSEELEKMASSEQCEKEYMDRIEGAVRMSGEINRQFGFGSAFGTDGGEVTRMGISFNSDGTTSFFAELEKSSASQREHIEKAQEEKRAQKKEDAKKADHNTKRTTVQADSMEELLEKIRRVDWNTVKTGNEPGTGRRFDISI